MTELSQGIFNHFQIRKTRKQKQAFIQYLQTYIPELQVQKMGFPSSQNLVIGDPETARILLSAHYDTCPQLPFPNFIMPKKPFLSILYSIVIVVPFVAAYVLLSRFLPRVIQNPWVLFFTFLVLYVLTLTLLLAGPANRHTANDNTSGVITLLEIYAALPQEQKDNVCFIFFDNEEKGLLGSAAFRQKHKKLMKDKLLINFDCVSDGDHFLFGISKQANQKYRVALAQTFTSTETKTVMLESLKKVYYPSDQAGFPVSIAVASLNYNKIIGYYMNRIHTSRDTVFDEANITYLTQQTISFIDHL